MLTCVKTVPSNTLKAEILIMFSFALVGMEAFAGRVNEGCCGPEYAGYHGNSSAVNISDRDYDDAMNLCVAHICAYSEI